MEPLLVSAVEAMPKVPEVWVEAWTAIGAPKQGMFEDNQYVHDVSLDYWKRAVRTVSNKLGYTAWIITADEFGKIIGATLHEPEKLGFRAEDVKDTAQLARGCLVATVAEVIAAICKAYKAVPQKASPCTVASAPTRAVIGRARKEREFHENAAKELLLEFEAAIIPCDEKADAHAVEPKQKKVKPSPTTAASSLDSAATAAAAGLPSASSSLKV